MEQRKSLKMILHIALLSCMMLGCKKDLNLNAGLTSSDQLKYELVKPGNGSENHSMGGTMGCFISYADSQGNDSFTAGMIYDQCMESVLGAGNILGSSSSNYGPQPQPAQPDMTNKLTTDRYLMHLYFGTFGIESSLGEIDPSLSNPQILMIQENLLLYNQIINSVFSNGNNWLIIPSDRLERRNAVINYLTLNYGYTGTYYETQLTPTATCDMFLSYIDLVYGKNFYLPEEWELIFYPRSIINPASNLQGIRADPDRPLFPY
jgi:hypothetical protein